MPYHAYILECRDGTLYSGSTVDLEKRVHDHNHSKSGAKYTRARRPVTLCYSKRTKTLAAARAAEAALKRLTREEKLKLIRTWKKK